MGVVLSRLMFFLFFQSPLQNFRLKDMISKEMSVISGFTEF